MAHGGGGVSGRVAVVVGAGGELGRATAIALTGAGFTVVGVDRNQKALDELPGSGRPPVLPVRLEPAVTG